MAANPITRKVATQTLTRLLGPWRTPPGTSRPAAYQELADRMGLLVVDGRVPAGRRLPAERELAAALGVSRTTVIGAFRILRDRGLIVSTRGSGSITALPRSSGPVVTQPGAGADLSHATLPGWAELPLHVAAALERLPDALATHALDFYGTPELRTAIAERFTERGVATTPRQILITLGAQHALGLLIRTFCSPGDRVALESPTYPHAIDAFRDARTRPVAVPMAEGAADIDEWERTLLTVRPALAYLIPDFHNPTGGSIRDEDRARLVAAAARSGTVLIADETTAELDIDRSFATQPLAVHAALPSAAVVTIGSASKTIWHGLRIGWIRADSTVIDRIAARRPASDLGTPVLEQLTVASVLPHMDRLLAQRREHLRTTRDEILAALTTALPTWQVPTVPGGLCLWANIGDPASSALALTARTLGLTITSGPRFGLDGAFERHIRIPITAPAPDARAAVELLARAWDRTPHAAPRADEFTPLL